MIILVVFLSILISVVTAAIVPFSQWKPPILSIPFYQLNINNFKRKKIKRLSFLFRGIYGTDVKKDGVIYPMYIMHIIGFVIATASLISTIVLYFTTDLGLNTLVIDAFVLIGFCVVYFLVIDICGLISKRRDKKRDKIEQG